MLVAVRSVVALLLLALVLGACTSVKTLDTPARGFQPDAKARVAKRIQDAIDDKEWTAAWNMAVDMGATRAKFEDIAARAVIDDAAAEQDMVEALRARYGTLGPGFLTPVRAHVDHLIAVKKDLERAVEIELLTANDAPRYERAWAIYDHVPADDAPDVLEMIADARAEAEESHD